MSVTLQQIARLAGVSRGTVDRSLNNRGQISPEVDARIKAIARELGYSPNRAGRALASRKNPVKMGVLLNSLDNHFFDEVIQGVQSAAGGYADFALDLDLRQTKGYDVQQQLDEIDSLVNSGIRGLVLMPLNDSRVSEKIKELDERGIPVVTLNTDIEDTPRIAYCGSDYLKGGETAAGLMGLITGGSACVGIVTGSVMNAGHNKRITGFNRAIRAEYPAIAIADIVENNDDDILSYRVTRGMLEQHPEITALYLTAAGVRGAVQAAGELRPGGLTILSFDASAEIAALVRQGKISATICQQPYRQGFEAVDLLFKAIVNNEKPQLVFHYTECEIKIRQNI